jgi:hypothetical protein
MGYVGTAEMGYVGTAELGFAHGYAWPSPDAAGFRARGWSQSVTCPR